jgi:signal transduction histidine kinase
VGTVPDPEPADDLAAARKRIAALERKLEHCERAREHLEELNDRNQHILSQSNHELAEANAELQLALERLMSAQARLVQAEKMASLGQLVAGVAHEINNPINFICSAVPSLRRDIAKLLAALPEPDESQAKLGQRVQKLIGAIDTGADRSAEIVRGLRLFSRLDEAEFKPTDLHQALDATAMLLGHQLGEHVTLVKDYGDIPLVEGYAGQLNQVFMNLLVNAIQAIEPPGTVRVRTSRVGERVSIEISDTGIGMTSEVLARACDPFFTTKDVGTGTGLGLSIVHGIVERHAGELVIESRAGEGTTMRVLLPIEQPSKDAP